MEIVKIILGGVIVLGILGFILVYNTGKAMTYHRPCGGGRHNA
jgi:hypothetical protein